MRRLGKIPAVLRGLAGSLWHGQPARMGLAHESQGHHAPASPEYAGIPTGGTPVVLMGKMPMPPHARRLGKIPAVLCGLACDQRGASSVEYALLIALVGMPVFALFYLKLLPLMAEYYRMVVFIETLPMP